MLRKKKATKKVAVKSRVASRSSTPRSKKRTPTETRIKKLEEKSAELQLAGIDIEETISTVRDHETQVSESKAEIEEMQQKIKAAKATLEFHRKKTKRLLDEAQSSLVVLDPGYQRSEKFMKDLQAEADEYLGKQIFVRCPDKICSCADPFVEFRRGAGQKIQDSYRSWWKFGLDNAGCWNCANDQRREISKVLKEKPGLVVGSRILTATKKIGTNHFESKDISGPWPDGKAPFAAMSTHSHLVTPAAFGALRYALKVLVPGQKSPVWVLCHYIKDPKDILKGKISQFKGQRTQARKGVNQARKTLEAAEKRLDEGIPKLMREVEDFAQKFKIDLEEDWDKDRKKSKKKV